MNKRFGHLLVAGIALAVGAAVLAASVQDQTRLPGQPTQARVWIQNQGKTEAVPVRIEDVALERPIRVEVSGVPTVTTAPGSIIQARVARQSWEYEKVTITAGQDPVALLSSAGADGWEATGLAFPVAGGTAVIMKRPR